jgi:hypothetical protein
MLRSYRPCLVEGGTFPESARIYEITRVCVDRGIEPDARKMILPVLLAAVQELRWCRQQGCRTAVLLRGARRPNADTFVVVAPGPGCLHHLRRRFRVAWER